MFSCSEETLRQSSRRVFLACRHVDQKPRPLQRKTMPSALQSDGIVLAFSFRFEGADTSILYWNKDWLSADMCLFLQLSRKISLSTASDPLGVTVGSYLPPERWRTMQEALLPLTQFSYSCHFWPESVCLSTVHRLSCLLPVTVSESEKEPHLSQASVQSCTICSCMHFHCLKKSNKQTKKIHIVPLSVTLSILRAGKLRAPNGWHAD